MSDSSKPLVGKGPLAFTDARGSQRFVPLSALVLTGGKVALTQSWAEKWAEAAFSPVDQNALLLLAGQALEAGELTVPPVAAKQQAVVFRAVAPGSGGNAIEVTIKYGEAPDDPAAALQRELTLRVTEKQVYAGLTSAAEAVESIGWYKLPKSGEGTLGSGLVQVKSAPAKDGLPEPFSTQTVGTGTLKVLVAGGTTEYFSLAMRKNLDPDVTIAVDEIAKTYTVTAEYDSGEHVTTISKLAALHEAVTSLVTLEAPAGGYALPAETEDDTPLRLTGGAPDIEARGTAFTS